jgi:hypothetical protein
MSRNETNSTFDAVPVSISAATRLIKDCNKSDETDERLTPDLLATAIKLASLSTDHQERLTPITANAAVKLAKYSSTQEEQHRNLTPELLAIALKFATRVSQSAFADNCDTVEVSTNRMKTAMAMTQESQSLEPITSEILADATKPALKSIQFYIFYPLSFFSFKQYMYFVKSYLSIVNKKKCFCYRTPPLLIQTQFSL